MIEMRCVFFFLFFFLCVCVYTSVCVVLRCLLWWKIISKKESIECRNCHTHVSEHERTAASSGREQTEEDKGGVCVVCVCMLLSVIMQ